MNALTGLASGCECGTDRDSSLRSDDKTALIFAVPAIALLLFAGIVKRVPAVGAADAILDSVHTRFVEFARTGKAEARGMAHQRES